MLVPSSPVLTCEQAAAFEGGWFNGDESHEWAAMQRAGAAVAAALTRDFSLAPIDLAAQRLLVLAGKGHNGGDALLAAAHLVRAHAELQVEIGFVFGTSSLRPLARRAWRELVHAAPTRVRQVRRTDLAHAYATVIDGVFGFQFRPPLPRIAADWLTRVNALPIALRAAVDLPSGWAEAAAFRADVTYATGIVKTPLLTLPNAGRRRYLDLGFFRGDEPAPERVLDRPLLAPLARWRACDADKRHFGHVFIVGGSRSYPGAIMMTVQGALRSGAGLVTAFVPESLAPAFAAACPEAMWCGCPETNEGGLSFDTASLIRRRLDRADAVVIGPGLAREPETLAWVEALVPDLQVPVVLDADALQPAIVRAGKAARVLTPHAGEYQRIAGGEELKDFSPASGAVTVLKGPVTRISDGGGIVYHSFGGGPILARGGSGDILAGMIGTLLAQAPSEPLLAACRAVVWQGAAAEAWAIARGEVAVRTTELLDFLGPALREA